MKPQITINIYTPQELNHSSYVQTGLFELEHDGWLKTNVMLSVKKRLGTIHIKDTLEEYPKAPHPKTSFYELINHENGQRIRFATDLYDASHSFSKYALEHCDFVFKRNFESKYVEQLPDAFQKKLYSFGWSFKVQSAVFKGESKRFISFVFTNLFLNIKLDRYVIKRLVTTFLKLRKHWANFMTTPRLDVYKEQSALAQKDYIIYQTRCFAHENEPQLKSLHEQRYRIILLLKHHFPDLFRGGLIPSKLVNEKYKDAITNLKTDPQSYLELVKSSKIGIYTQGIQDSPAWKMAEYLSQGKVVIAQRFKTELPVPLEDKKHVLFFDEEHQIPELCKLVLGNTELASNLAHNGRRYYETHISPKQNIKRIIELMLQSAK